MSWRIRHGNALKQLKLMEAESVDCCVTSPPYYGLRDYGVRGQVGLESTPEEYIDKLVKAFRRVRRVLKMDGTLWVVIGDSYAANRTYQVPDSKHVDVGNSKASRVPLGCKPKDLIGIPWMLAFALRADGWYLRSEIIWHKPNVMPESVRDRPTSDHEHVFLLSKSPKYYYDTDAIREKNGGTYRPNLDGKKLEIAGKKTTVPGQTPQNDRCGNHPLGRNKRSVWTINTKPFKGAHFAVFPPALPELCILAGSREGGRVLDPFCGAGTTGVVARQLGRSFTGIEISGEYCEMARARIRESRL